MNAPAPRKGFRPAKMDGPAFRELRKSLDLSRERLATGMGITPLTILRWEHGQSPVPYYAQHFLGLLFHVPALLAFVRGDENRQPKRFQKWTPQDQARSRIR